MINLYKILLNLVKLFVNILFVFQIALIILIFLTASYWFFDLIGSSLFNFVQPLANSIIDFIKIFYNRDINVGGVYVDGSLLLFDIIALIVIFIISKSKYYIYLVEDFLIKQINTCKKNIEDNFNVKLRKDAEETIQKYNSAAFLITFNAKDLKVDRFWGGDSTDQIQKTEQFIIEEFCLNLDKLKFATYKKGNNKIMIYLDNFNKVDSILNLIYHFINKNRQEMNKNKWSLDFYCGAVVYGKDERIELDVLPKLESLLKTKQKNEIVCFGNFSLRYNLKEKPLLYNLKLKGSYDIDGGSDIYHIIKKN